MSSLFFCRFGEPALGPITSAQYASYRRLHATREMCMSLHFFYSERLLQEQANPDQVGHDQIPEPLDSDGLREIIEPYLTVCRKMLQHVDQDVASKSTILTPSAYFFVL